MNLVDQPLNQQLIEASKKDDTSLITSLLERGVKIDATDNHGNTALHHATGVGGSEPQYNTALFLLDNGATLEVQNDSRETPLHLAVYTGSLDIVKLLLDWGARADAKTQSGETPLYRAAYTGSLDIVKLLLDWGARADVSIDGVWTPLHQAVGAGNLDIVKLLLERGAETDVRNKFGYTPLYLAVYAEKTNIIRVLLQYGAYSYPDAAADQLLEKYFNTLFNTLIASNELTESLYTTLLLAGVRVVPDYPLPANFNTIQTHLNSTIATLLKPLNLSPETVSAVAPSVLRTLPPLLKWCNKDNKTLITEFGVAMPKELMDGVTDLLVEELRQPYDLPLPVAQHLVVEGTAHPDEYRAFSSDLWKHNWLNGPHTPPVTLESITTVTEALQRLRS